MYKTKLWTPDYFESRNVQGMITKKYSSNSSNLIQGESEIKVKSSECKIQEIQQLQEEYNPATKITTIRFEAY